MCNHLFFEPKVPMKLRSCNHPVRKTNRKQRVVTLIQKCFRRKFLQIFEDVWSLHICFCTDSFWLLGWIVHANVQDVFCATQYIMCLSCEILMSCFCCSRVNTKQLWASFWKCLTTQKLLNSSLRWAVGLFRLFSRYFYSLDFIAYFSYCVSVL